MKCLSRGAAAALALAAVISCGCSIKKMAVNQIGNALASGGSTFESDDDPDLVGEALPFSLKLMESLLAESPRHTGLLLAAASGFTEYSYAFVGQPAERAFTENVEESNALRGRSRRLYLRARAYGMRALEVRYPGFGAALENDPPAALARVRKRDVPLLYWTAAAHGLMISASKDDPEMIAADARGGGVHPARHGAGRILERRRPAGVPDRYRSVAFRRQPPRSCRRASGATMNRRSAFPADGAPACSFPTPKTRPSRPRTARSFASCWNGR